MAVFTDIGKQTDPIKGVNKGIDTGSFGIKPMDPAQINNPERLKQVGFQESRNLANSFNVNTGNKMVDTTAGVAQSLPGLLTNLSIDPREGTSQEEVRAMQKAKTMGLAVDGAQIGGTIGNAVGGPLVGLMASFVGGAAGYAFGDSKRGEGLAALRKRENEKSTDEFYQREQDNLDSYLDATSSKRMKKEMDLIAQSQGYIT